MWALVQYDNRVLSPDIKYLIKRNRAYCRKHGYDHIFETKSYNLPVWWRKVKVVKKVLESGKYSGVMWLDSDAAVHDHNHRIEDIIIHGKSFYYSVDPTWGSDFNAGVWMVTNDHNGIAIMKKWMASYSPKDWTKKGRNWETLGEWSGSTYEQGSFIEYIIPKFKNFMQILPGEHIQSYSPDEHTFIVHFPRHYSDTHLPDYCITTRNKNTHNKNTRKNNIRKNNTRKNNTRNNNTRNNNTRKNNTRKNNTRKNNTRKNNIRKNHRK
jgi:hypothetical protein